MAGKPGRSGGSRVGSGRKTKEYHAAVEQGLIKICDKPVQAFRLVPCFVYVIHEVEQSGVCKVGITLHAGKRFSSLQVGTWRQLKLAHAFLLPTEEAAYIVEAHVHHALRDQHHRGEWFSTTPGQASALIRGAAQQCGFKIAE